MKGMSIGHHGEKILNCFLCENNQYSAPKANSRKCDECIDGNNFKQTLKRGE